MKKKILIFTISYPYLQASENTFLKYELEHLKTQFDKVTLVPQQVGGDRDEIYDFHIDESLSACLDAFQNKIKIMLYALKRKTFYLELVQNPRILLSPKLMFKLMQYLYKVRIFNKWFSKSEYINQSNIRYYTYWFNFCTTALCLQNINQRVVTRVHGADLYLERNNGYIPLRKQSIAKLGRIYCVSKAGIEYLNTHYSKFKAKYKLARIGVNQEIKAPLTYKTDNVFRIVSCSSLIPLKRVDLIIESIFELALNSPNLHIKYTHFGDGPLKKNLGNKISEFSSSNLEINLPGFLQNEKIIDFYANNFVDIFINLSTTEGLPVSMMEAQSFGIPCIGTDVGGVSEIITEKTGILLSENPKVMDVSNALKQFADLDTEEAAKMRIACFLNFKENFNAKVNFQSFVKDLINL